MSKPSNTNNPKAFANKSYLSEKSFCMSYMLVRWLREREKRGERRKKKDLKKNVKEKRFIGGYREGEHLLPFRTEKLSPLSPMILQQVCGKVGRRQLLQ